MAEVQLTLAQQLKLRAGVCIVGDCEYPICRSGVCRSCYHTAMKRCADAGRAAEGGVSQRRLRDMAEEDRRKIYRDAWRAERNRLESRGLLLPAKPVGAPKRNAMAMELERGDHTQRD